MKIKLNIKSILVIAIIGVMSLVFFNKSFAAVTGKVSVETANIRKTIDTNAEILEQASKGESVQVIEKEGDWYKVKYNGVEGYVRADLLEVNESVAETTSTTAVEPKEETQNTESSNTETVTNVENTQVNVATENKNENTTNEGMYTVKEEIKLKILPLVNGMDIKTVAKDTTVNIIEVCNNWALAEIGMDRGWLLYGKLQKVEENVVQTDSKQEENKVAEEEQQQQQEEKKEENVEETKQESTEVAVQEKTMYVNWDVVNIREQATKASDTVGSLNKATEVTVIATDGEWSKVNVNGKTGYIKTSLLSETKPEVVTSRSLEQERQPIQTEEQEVAEEQPVEETVATESNSELGQQVCNYARQYLGCNYVYGGTTPSGFDCSGFTQYVFKHFGIGLNRTAEAQASNGSYVPKSQLQAGDLLIFTHHAGIYLGDGTFIHAANSNTGVIITSLNSDYYVRNYITARRVI